MDANTDKTIELEDEALDAAVGGTDTDKKPTKHPAKVTIPDLKLGISYQDHQPWAE